MQRSDTKQLHLDWLEKQMQMLEITHQKRKILRSLQIISNDWGPWTFDLQRELMKYIHTRDFFAYKNIFIINTKPKRRDNYTNKHYIL